MVFVISLFFWSLDRRKYIARTQPTKTVFCAVYQRDLLFFLRWTFQWLLCGLTRLLRGSLCCSAEKSRKFNCALVFSACMFGVYNNLDFSPPFGAGKREARSDFRIARQKEEERHAIREFVKFNSRRGRNIGGKMKPTMEKHKNERGKH